MSGTMDPRQQFLFSTLPGLLGQAYDYVRRNPLQATADVAQAVTPGGALQDALAGSGQISQAAMRGDIGGMVGGAGAMGAGLLGAIPLAGMVGRGIRAFHGTPYKFDEFNIGKIGTGEGAQSYGRGLYFAEEPDVARAYRDRLLANSKEPQNLNTGGSDIQNMYSRIEGKASRMSPSASDFEYEKLNALEALMQYGDVLGVRSASNAGQISPRAMEWFEKNVAPNFQRTGSLYEVNINAGPKEFLNWDLPLSQQSRGVQESLQRFGLQADPEKANQYDAALLRALESNEPVTLPRMPRDPTGQEIYQRELRMNPEEARVALMQAGIPGTRYLDAGSRGVGGTYNYAVFDPEIIDIVRRYGVPGLLGAGAAGAGAAEMQQ